jgi:hypothetical protein
VGVRYPGLPSALTLYDLGSPATVGVSMKENLPRLCVPPIAPIDADRPARLASELGGGSLMRPVEYYKNTREPKASTHMNQRKRTRTESNEAKRIAHGTKSAA